MALMDTFNTIDPDDLQEWEELCAANDGDLARAWVTQKDWPRGTQGSGINACWKAALIARAPEVLAVLHEEGLAMEDSPPVRLALKETRMSTTPRAGEGFILEARQENHRSLLPEAFPRFLGRFCSENP